MEERKAQGAMFLKVTGILMIIGGAISLIMGIISVAGLSVLLAALGGAGAGIIIVAMVLALIGGVVELVAGIVGVKNCKNPDKSTTCMVWGIIVAVISVLSTILSTVGGQNFSVVSLILGLVLPVLYIIGAAFNKKAQ